ncbi:MAG: aminoglycoside phosphotransferase family protein [Candidatus Dojkabacteria bacterium]|nr:aminoglycoside phosphotransferase family protein [Candidatus Dojkabacteria bacterium]
MNNLSFGDVVQKLQEDYADLQKYDLTVQKQFVSKTGRKYNTFLVDAPDSPYGIFVAKSFWHENQNLDDEVRIMNFLSDKEVFVPKLLFPYKAGNTFIVMEYIKGTDAAELLQNPEHALNAFRSIGTSLSKVYEVSVPAFNKFWENDPTVWSEYVQEKFDERLTKAIDKDLWDQIRSIYQKGTEVIAEDAKSGSVLIHRDIYADNFIIEESTGRAILIDFAMARGGRPFYDLAKFYIIDLARHSEGQNAFLEGLNIAERSEANFYMLRSYILIELLGMINFYMSINQTEPLKHAQTCLRELVTEKGSFHELVKAYVT